MNKGFDPADLRRVLEAHAAFPDNDSAAARSIGVDRNTFRNRLSKAKADPSLASGPKPDPIEIRNLEFWKTKARQAEKRLADAEHTLRELAGMTQRQPIFPDWSIPAAARPGAPPAWQLLYTVFPCSAQKNRT